MGRKGGLPPPQLGSLDPPVRTVTAKHADCLDVQQLGMNYRLYGTAVRGQLTSTVSVGEILTKYRRFLLCLLLVMDSCII